MKRTFAFGAATQQGTWPVQEDGFFVDPLSAVFAVGDGFGGRGAGDMAVKSALEEVRNQRGTDAFGSEIMERIHLKLLKRNESLPVNRKGGCSFALAQIREDYLHLRQTGACSVFLYRAGKFSPVLVPQAAPRKEYLPLFPDNALGLPGDLQMEKRKFLLESADIVGICSGGVDWEGESFQQNFRQQIGFRESGEDLSSLTAHLVENADLSQQGWNRTLVLFEKT